MNKISHRITVSVICFLTILFGRLNAQCAFTGLNPNYCTNSAVSTLTPPSNIGGTFSGPGVNGSTFNPALAGPGTQTVTFTSSCTFYSVSQQPYNPSTTSGNSVLLTDDSESGILPIGFTFTFFCTAYNDFYISSNGFLEFSQTGQGCCAGQALPNGTNPSHLVAACWTDLNPGVGGTITYTTIGSSPNRTLVVNYNSVPYFNPNTTSITTQIKLFETSNVIEVHSTSIPSNTGYVKTMGIENLGGTSGYPAPLRNANATWTATTDCYRWTPGVTCTSSQVTTVYPTTITVAGNNSICVGAVSTLTATGNTTYTWSTGSNGANISVTPTVNTTYTVGANNSFGCYASSAITVTVDNTPTVTAVSSNTTGGICPNSPVTLNGVGATAYSWNNGITNNVSFNPTVSATYVVTGSNACGSATAAISLSIHPIPPITASVNNPTICSGSQIILNGGGGVGSYTWNPSAPNNVAFTPNSTANYTVRGASVLGCTATAVVGVTVLITPTIVPIATPTAICFGQTATLSSVGATGYTWSPGTNPNTPSISVSPPIPTTYTLVRTNGPCSNTSTVNLVVYPLPLVNASASPSQICVGTGINFVVVGPITQTWTPGGFTAANFTLFPNFSNTFTVIGSNGNCTASAVVPILVSPTPTISIVSSTNTVCEGNSANLTLNGNGPGPLSYTWQPSGNMNNSTELVTPPTTTIVTVAATNSLGCVNTAQQLIVVNPVPNMSLTSSLPYSCAGNPVTLSVANPSSNVVYTWNTGPTGPSISVNPSLTTTYISTGTNTQTGCQNTNSITLAVYISTFAVSSPTALCKGNTATLTANGPASSYFWANVNGGTTAPSVTVSPANTTTYSVVGTNGNCTSTTNVQVLVNPLPNVVAQVANTRICKFEVSTITGTGASTYSWNTGATTPVLSFTLSVTTTYTLTGTDLNGCSKTVTVTQFVATCIGMEDQKEGDAGIRIYPNPNNGNFVVSADESLKITIVNAIGQVVSAMSLNEENKKQVTVSSLPNGIYFVTAEKNGKKINKKIIVER